MARKSGFGGLWESRCCSVSPAIALGVDRAALAQLSLNSTSGVEQSLVSRLHPNQETTPNDAPARMMRTIFGSTLASIRTTRQVCDRPKIEAPKK